MKDHYNYYIGIGLLNILNYKQTSMADDLDDEWWETDNRGREEGIVLKKRTSRHFYFTNLEFEILIVCRRTCFRDESR